MGNNKKILYPLQGKGSNNKRKNKNLNLSKIKRKTWPNEPNGKGQII